MKVIKARNKYADQFSQIAEFKISDPGQESQLEINEILDGFVGTLPKFEASILSLMKYGASYRTIGREMAINKVTAKRLVFKIRNKLRKYITENS